MGGTSEHTDDDTVEHNLGNSSFNFGVAPSMATPNDTSLPTQNELLEATTAQDQQLEPSN